MESSSTDGKVMTLKSTILWNWRILSLIASALYLLSGCFRWGFLIISTLHWCMVFFGTKVWCLMCMPQIVLCSFLFFSFVLVSSSFFASPDPCLLFLVRDTCGICLSPIVDLTFLVHFSSAGLIFMFSAVGSIFLFVSVLESGQLKTASFTSHEAVLFSMDVIIIDVMLVNISSSWFWFIVVFEWAHGHVVPVRVSAGLKGGM